MSPDANRHTSFPEILAALADDELNPPDCERVRAWLAEHAEAASCLETQRKLGWRHGSLWRMTAPSSPTTAAWDSLRVRIDHALSAPRPVERTFGASRRRLLVGASVVAAAAVVAALWFPQNSSTVAKKASGTVDVFAVASDGDVEILRIMEADVDRLVVGEPPLRRPIILAGVEDVDGLRVAKDTDGMMPLIMMDKAAAPMIMAPIAGK